MNNQNTVLIYLIIETLEKLYPKDIKNSDYIIGYNQKIKPIIINNLEQHTLLLGETGSGKTQFLYNIINQNIKNKDSGSIFIDTKNDIYNFNKYKNIVLKNNREHDLHIVNFTKPISNTFLSINLFDCVSFVDACDIVENSIFGNSNNENFFIGQSKMVLSIVFGILSYIKEVKGKSISLHTLKEATSLNAFLVNLIPASENNPNIPNEKLLIHNNLLSYSKFWIPKAYDFRGTLVAEAVVKYLAKYGATIAKSLTEQIPEIPEQMTVQHGYSETQFSDFFSLLKTYPHIFNSTNNNIDINKYIFSNKLLYFMFPNLNIKSKEIILSIITGIIKSKICSIFGSDIENKFILEQFIKNKSTSFLIIDELDFLVDKSKNYLETILAQSRSIKLANILSCSNLNYLKDNTFSQRISANCCSKILLKSKGLDSRFSIEKKQAEWLEKSGNGIGIILNNKKIQKIYTPFIL